LFGAIVKLKLLKEMKFFINELLENQIPRQTWSLELNFMYGDGDAHASRVIHTNDEEALSKALTVLRKLEGYDLEYKKDITKNEEYDWLISSFLSQDWPIDNNSGDSMILTGIQLFYICGNGYKYSTIIEE
jgi:hypothetical protein